jgi:hypothetical protein
MPASAYKCPRCAGARRGYHSTGDSPLHSAKFCMCVHAVNLGMEQCGVGVIQHCSAAAKPLVYMITLLVVKC